MIPLRARLIARRHRDLVGRPIISRRVGAGPVLPLILVGVVVLIGLLLGLSPGADPTTTVGITIFFSLLMFVTYLFTTDARLVVCERGVILGRLVPRLPFSPTYVMAGREIDPRSVCVVTSGAVAAKELGMPFFFFQYKTFPLAAGTPALVFVGPWGSDITANRDLRHRRPTRRSHFIFSHRRAVSLADEILQAIGRDGGLPPEFAAHNGLRPIELTGQPEDAVRQIPGA